MSFFKSQISKQTAILACSPVPLLLISEDGLVSFANDKAKQILGSDVLAGRSVSDILSVKLQEILNTQNTKLIHTIEKQNETNQVIEIQSSSIPNEPYFLVSLNDITRSHSLIQSFLNNRTEEEQNNHKKNLLLIKMANNLKAPLHSIIGISQAILEGLGGDVNEKQEKYLKIIHKNSSELLALIEKLINLSEVEAQTLEISYKNFDLLNTLTTSITVVKPYIDEKKLQLKIDTEELEKKTCYTDENILKVILNNLLENAIISCDIGSITIKLATPNEDIIRQRITEYPVNEKGFLLVEVIDTGVGIQSNELPDIFDPYIQVDKNTKKNLLKGLTLGITKSFVEKLNGKIWVESELMKESKFSFIIPIDKNLEKQTEEISEEISFEKIEEKEDFEI